MKRHRDDKDVRQIRRLGIIYLLHFEAACSVASLLATEVGGIGLAARDSRFYFCVTNQARLLQRGLCTEDLRTSYSEITLY